MTLKVLDLFSGKSIWLDKKGYACVWVDGKTKKCHVLVWESANGPKPKGHDIHHINENKSDYTLDNLQLMTQEDHQKLHAGWEKTNGEWSHKPCNGCDGRKLSLDSFYTRNNKLTALCKSCHVKKTEEWKYKNIDKVRDIKRRSYLRSKNENS
jgi:hypothetical protein